MWQILHWYKCSVSTINQAVPLCPEANHSGIRPRRAQSGKLAFKHTHTHPGKQTTACCCKSHTHQRPLKNSKKGNVWLITNKHINNYAILQSSYNAPGIALGNTMVIVNALYHIITERTLSLFWMTIKVLPCCNYCYCVTPLSDICTIYCTQNRHQINIESD